MVVVHVVTIAARHLAASPTPPNWGVSGFTHNPFAKLEPGDDKKQ